MRASAVVFKENDFKEFDEYNKLISIMGSLLGKAEDRNVDIIVFPGFLGCLHEDWKIFVESILRLSLEFKNIHICPGSYYEICSDKTYHSSCIIKNGRIILRQRQLYLAKWEREEGLSRGNKLETVDINSFKTAIILSTDTFYPQVSRHASLNGVNLVLSPMAIKGGSNRRLQLAGLWNSVQQNLFFGIESGFKWGSFSSNCAIHAPLEMTEEFKGYLAIENGNEDERMLIYDLDEAKRQEGIKKFDVLSKLNKEIYRHMFR